MSLIVIPEAAAMLSKKILIGGSPPERSRGVSKDKHRRSLHHSAALQGQGKEGGSLRLFSRTEHKGKMCTRQAPHLKVTMH